MELNWNDIKELSIKLISDKNLSFEYSNRINDELYEIEKQGSNAFWVDAYNKKLIFKENKNGLVLPFILGLTKIDPIKDGKHIIVETNDKDDESMDILIITLEDGKVIEIPADSNILVDIETVKAGDLVVGDDIYFQN